MCISIVIALAVGSLLFGVWFPPPYFHASGGDRLILILMSIDLAVGPLLTLVVFVRGKRGLKFDLFIIGTLQIAALLYGMMVITQSRPVYVVAAFDRFVAVSANELDEADLATATLPEFSRLPWTGPRLIGARVPSDAKERSELLFAGAAGKDLERQPKYYVPIEDVIAELAKHAKALNVLSERSEINRREIDRALAEHGIESSQVAWVPLVASRDDLVMLIHKESGMPIGPIILQPWNQ